MVVQGVVRDVEVTAKYTPGLLLACVSGGWALVGLLIEVGLVELRHDPAERLHGYADAIARAARWSSDRAPAPSGRLTPIEAHMAAVISLLVGAATKTQIDVNSQVRVALGMPKSGRVNRFMDGLFMVTLGVVLAGWIVGSLLPVWASVPVLVYFGFKRFDRAITTFDNDEHDQLLLRCILRLTLPGIAVAAAAVVVVDRLIGLQVS